MLLFAVAVAPLVQVVNAQGGSRLALTAALAEDRTVTIDDYVVMTAPIDRIESEGHVYSDKAPLQPVLAVPAYALARTLGAESIDQGLVHANLTAWVVALATALVPTMITLVLVHVVASRISPEQATLATVSVAFGTMVPLFASHIFGHALAGLFGFSAHALVSDNRDLSARRLTLAGVLAGAAVAAEYPLALVAAVVAVDVALRARWRSGWFLLGLLPGALVLAGYQTIAFGDPFAISYESKDLAGGSDVGLALQPLSTWFDATLGSRGVLVLTPVVAVALVAAVMQTRQGGPARRHAATALAIAGLITVMIVTRPSAWPNPIGGEVPITRHYYPLMPFLGVPLTYAWTHWRRFTAGTTVLGGCLMLLPLLTEITIPGNADLLPWYRAWLRDVGVTDTVFTLAAGRLGWGIHLVLVAVAAGWAIHAATRWPDRSGAPPSATGDGPLDQVW